MLKGSKGFLFGYKWLQHMSVGVEKGVYDPLVGGDDDIKTGPPRMVCPKQTQGRSACTLAKKKRPPRPFIC